MKIRENALAHLESRLTQLLFARDNDADDLRLHSKVRQRGHCGAIGRHVVNLHRLSGRVARDRLRVHAHHVAEVAIHTAAVPVAAVADDVLGVARSGGAGGASGADADGKVTSGHWKQRRNGEDTQP